MKEIGLWGLVTKKEREREGRGIRLKSNLDQEWYISPKVKQRRINLSLGPNYPASLVRVTVLLQDLGQGQGWAGIMIFVISWPGTSLTLLMGLKLLCMLKMLEEFLIYWFLGHIPKDSDLTDLSCRLGMGNRRIFLGDSDMQLWLHLTVIDKVLQYLARAGLNICAVRVGRNLALCF